MDDFELFSKIKLRDRDAFNTLFRKYYTPLCRFSFATCLSQEDAEESVQDMFVNFWEKAPTLKIETSVKAYLYTSARNFTLNLIHKQQTEQRYLSEYAELAHDHASNNRLSEDHLSEDHLFGDHLFDENRPDEKTSDNQLARFIQSGVQQLPEKCREIFILCKQEGLTYDEISSYLNISEKTVDNQMGIALRKLREYLQPRLQKLLALLLFYLFT